jgi:uncharacterized protein YpuA (DUF1002 family)
MSWKRLRKAGVGALVVALIISLLPSLAHADAVVGETVVTLGADLTPQQREAILKEMNVDQNVQTIEVTNEEEHRYLGKYVSKATIGTRALSSAKITLAEKGSGITVQTNNITHITETMYANALITAGVKDAEVYVTAPTQVSGTAGLTGILKAFEAAADTKISDEQKEVANEEMVRTSELGEKIGDPDKAAQFMMDLKQKVAEEQPKTQAEFRDLIINVSNEYNINLSEQDLEQLTQLMQRLSELDIDWGALSDQVKKLRDNLDEFLNSEETKGFLETLLDWLASLLDALKEIFSSN